jgi:hypothetical protein
LLDIENTRNPKIDCPYYTVLYCKVAQYNTSPIEKKLKGLTTGNFLFCHEQIFPSHLVKVLPAHKTAKMSGPQRKFLHECQNPLDIKHFVSFSMYQNNTMLFKFLYPFKSKEIEKHVHCWN